MTVMNPDGSETVYPYSSQIAQAYRALSYASKRMGKSGYVEHCARYPKVKSRPAFTPSAAHEEVVKAMPKLLSGEITPEEAMGMLHEYDIKKERTA